ncbi:MAG: hypothetical protein MJZ35_09845 [Bacteroidaceae bacterium]|nr:hypothetical protein [Bacteroidaceae bacterium]
MKKLFLLLSCIMAFSSMGYAQKRKTASKPAANPNLPAISLNDAISQYRFEDAEAILSNEISVLRRQKMDISQAEEMLRQVQRAKARMRATEKVCFIDSVLVKKAEVLKAIHLSDEVGQIKMYADYFQKPDTMMCTVYVSQIGDQIIASQPSNSSSMLFSANKVGNEWTTLSSLNEKGLDSHDDLQQNYPFMLNDGATLYYAAKGEESMGGYDIFMTRYDAEEQSFLAPENIGMPFNSPANDYLYAIDEYSNLGYFVTDRNCSGDTVCVYTFIPNQSRKIYNVDELNPDALRALAKLNSIRATWTDQEAVQQSIARLRNVQNSGSVSDNSNNSGASFVVNDNVTYTLPSQFKNAQAKQLYETLLVNITKLEQVNSILEGLRDDYHAASASGRSAIKNNVLTKENEQRQLVELILKQKKQIRQLEK